MDKPNTEQLEDTLVESDIQETDSTVHTDTDTILDPEALHAENQELQKVLAESQTRIKELEQQVEENFQKFLRSRADLENYRRRSRKEKEEALQYAPIPLLETILPVLDNFERALDAADGASNTEMLQEGVEMVYRQFLQALSKSGLVLIEAVGRPFDPHVHNAVMQVESKQYESGTVVEELQAGYRYFDRVIRPTMVKVSN